MDDETGARRPAWLRWLPIGALAAAVVVLIVLVVVHLGSPSSATAADRTPAATTTASRTTAAPTSAPGTHTDPVKATTPPPTTPPPTTSARQAAEQADLAAEAARLTRPLSLTSPAAWDQYLPAGKKYPGASTAEDIATCPHLADRLTASLGKKMSYWTGTLPQGPYGCSWVPVPLSYDGPYTYAYNLNVGYQADGTTTEQVRSGDHENGPDLCPGVDVPAVAAGAVLVRCQQPTDLEYTLALPDTRRRDGVWLLHATARTGAPHSAAEALDDLIAAVRAVYG